MSNSQHYPILIIGAGPIGLAAAAHLAAKQQSFLLFEKGSDIASSVRQWQHVRMFSPWSFNIDAVAKKLLQEQGWEPPVDDAIPTGRELLHEYLHPLSHVPIIRENLRVNHEVIGVSRFGKDKMTTAGRDETPFEVIVSSSEGERRLLARAILDTSGVWHHPNTSLSSGVWTNQERVLCEMEKIDYGIVNRHADGERLSGKRVAVVGSGHSAIQSLLELNHVKRANPLTDVHWVVRKTSVEQAYGGETKDALETRGELGVAVRRLVESRQVTIHEGFMVNELRTSENQISLIGIDGRELHAIDHVIVNTGARPDFSFLREVRLDIDEVTESSRVLAPMIDPNLHSCGTVRPHGEGELRHPEKDVYILGSKSYGRAPTFLLTTGYEQVRSVVAHLIGDVEEARAIKLKLPETGVCHLSLPESNVCCS